MLELKEYNKEELEEYFKSSFKKTSNLTDRLKKDGYEFKTSGRGATYRITITAQPQTTLSSFAKQYLKIDARDDKKLAHLLSLLLDSNYEYLLSTTPSAISNFTYVAKETCKLWIDSLVSVGLLQYKFCEERYYATYHKQEGYADFITGDYIWFMELRLIKKEDWDKSYQAFHSVYDKYINDLDTNPNMILDMLIHQANQEKKASLDGWWPCIHSIEPLEVNRDWPHLDELISLLEQYPYEEYRQPHKGNIQKEEEAWDKKMKAWEEELENKRKTLRKKLDEQPKEKCSDFKNLLEHLNEKWKANGGKF